jgi:FRG domain
VNEIRAESWVELNELLYEGSWNEELGLFRSNFAYRGRADASESLHTSLMRLGGDSRALEVHLVRNFRKYAARDVVPEDSIWNWLALG